MKKSWRQDFNKMEKPLEKILESYKEILERIQDPSPVHLEYFYKKEYLPAALCKEMMDIGEQLCLGARFKEFQLRDLKKELKKGSAMGGGFGLGIGFMVGIATAPIGLPFALGALLVPTFVGATGLPLVQHIDHRVFARYEKHAITFPENIHRFKQLHHEAYIELKKKPAPSDEKYKRAEKTFHEYTYIPTYCNRALVLEEQINSLRAHNENNQK